MKTKIGVAARTGASAVVGVVPVSCPQRGGCNHHTQKFAEIGAEDTAFETQA